MKQQIPRLAPWALPPKTPLCCSKSVSTAKSEQPTLDQLYTRIRHILLKGRKRAAVAVNLATVESYWQVGREIVEEEQGGKDRAA